MEAHEADWRDRQSFSDAGRFLVTPDSGYRLFRTMEQFLRGRLPPGRPDDNGRARCRGLLTARCRRHQNQHLYRLGEVDHVRRRSSALQRESISAKPILSRACNRDWHCRYMKNSCRRLAKTSNPLGDRRHPYPQILRVKEIGYSFLLLEGQATPLQAQLVPDMARSGN